MKEKLEKAKQAVDAQEGRIDRWLDRLKLHPHTARIVIGMAIAIAVIVLIFAVR